MIPVKPLNKPESHRGQINNLKIKCNIIEPKGDKCIMRKFLDGSRRYLTLEESRKLSQYYAAQHHAISKPKEKEQNRKKRKKWP